MRTKEYLVAVQVRDDALALTTMLFHDEVRPTEGIPTGGKKPAKRAVDDAVAIIEELSTDWEPESYTDCYRERLRRVIERKRKGQTIEAPQAEREPKPVPDLMEALQRTLENVRAGEDPRSESDGEDEDLGGLSREELYERAQREKIPGRTKMSKKRARRGAVGGIGMRRAALLILILLATVAGCGSDSNDSSSNESNGIESKSPQQVLEQTAAALRSVKSFHIEGTQARGTETVKADVAGPRKLRLDLKQRDAKARMVFVDGAVYMNANAAFWREAEAGQDAKELDGRWLKVPGAEGDLQKIAKEVDPANLSRCLLRDHGTLAPGGTAQGGRAAGRRDRRQGRSARHLSGPALRRGHR